MKNRFEKLKVWEEAHNFVLGVYKLSKPFPKEEKYSLTDQLIRSASSVATNIVEENERKSNKEFVHFLYTSKASLAESRFHLLLSKDLKYISEQEYQEMVIKSDNIGKMINGLIKYLSKKVK